MFGRVASLACMALLASAGALAAAGYSMKPAVTVNGPWVTAGDLLLPKPDGKLAELKIKRLVPPGKSMEIQRELLLLKVRNARLTGGLDIQGVSSTVTASERLVRGADLRAFGENYLKERAGAIEGASGVQVKASSEIADIAVPDRAVRFEIAARPGQVWRGNIMLRVSLMQTAEDGSELEVGQATLPFLVTVKQKLLVASRAIRRGEVLGDSNVRLESVDATFNREEGYADLAETAGLKARSAIPAGRMIEPLMVERPPVVRRGDVVKLVVRSGMIAVETSARVMRDGAAGDMVPVETQEGRKQVQARVIDARTVVSDAR